MGDLCSYGGRSRSAPPSFLEPSASTGQSGRLGLSPSGVLAATTGDDGRGKWEMIGDATEVTLMGGGARAGGSRLATSLGTATSAGKGHARWYLRGVGERV